MEVRPEVLLTAEELLATAVEPLLKPSTDPSNELPTIHSSSRVFRQ